MTRVEHTVTFDASPETVWAFVSDVRRCPEWVTFADEMHHVDEGNAREGYRYVEYGGVGPMRSESEWEIVEFDPPHRQVHVGDLGIMEPTLTITVEPEGKGTRWTQAVEFEALPRLRLLGRLLERLFIRRQMDRGLGRTMAEGKRLVERETTAATDETAAAA